MIKKLIFTGLVLSLNTINASEELIIKDIEKCASISSITSRIICYDDLALSLNLVKSKDKTIKSKGKWILNEEKSPIDDSVNVTLYVESNEPITDKYRKKQTPTLILRCSENTTNAFINWGMFLGSDYADVLVRLDKEKAKTSSWLISTNHESIFAKKNISFIKKLMKHETLLTQITPYGENPVMTTFDIQGLKEAIKPLRKACGW